MAKVSLYLDLRAVKDGQSGPLKIKVFHKGKAIMIPTTVKLTANRWQSGKIVNHPRAKAWNSMIALKMANISSEILERDVTGALGSMSSSDLKARLMKSIGHSNNEDKPNLFLSAHTSAHYYLYYLYTTLYEFIENPVKCFIFPQNAVKCKIPKIMIRLISEL